MDAQVGALGKVLAEEAIGVLVRPPLPRALRIAEVDRQARVDVELGVRCEFRALIPRQGAAELRRQRA